MTLFFSYCRNWSQESSNLAFVIVSTEDLLSHKRSHPGKQFNVGDSVVMYRKIETLVALQSDHGGFIKDMANVIFFVYILFIIYKYYLYLNLPCVSSVRRKNIKLPSNLLNKITEIEAKCRHMNKFYLTT